MSLAFMLAGPRRRLAGRLAGAALVWACAAALLPAAQPDAPAFQFVSLRRADPPPCPPMVLCIGSGGENLAPPGPMSILPGGRFEAQAQTVENLARVAYGFEHLDPRKGIVESPRAVRLGRDRYHLIAVADREWTEPPPGTAIPPELRTMLRELLVERFQMRARIELRRVDVYALRRSKANREPGAALQPSTSECLGPFAEFLPHAETDMPRCAFRLETTQLRAGSVTMTELAQLVSRIPGLQIDRAVVDDTGLDGRYDVSLSLPPLRIVSTSVTEPGFRAVPGITQSELRSAGVLNALDEQLGLTLHRAKLPLPTLVIEQVKSPRVD